MRAKEFIVENTNSINFKVKQDNSQILVVALEDDRKIGYALFNKLPSNKVEASMIRVAPSYRGKQVAMKIYDYIKEIGYVIIRSSAQTDAGYDFWNKHRGEERVWEEEAQPKSRKIGKRIGGDLYVHKNYAVQAGVPEDILKRAMSQLPKGYDFTAVKYNPKEGSISFIESPDFDTANEPAVGNAIKVYADGTVKTTKGLQDPMIWHHKWQWVPDDYPGFDVNKSKERSELWKSKLGTNREVSSRIGRQSYWQNWLKQSELPT